MTCRVIFVVFYGLENFLHFFLCESGFARKTCAAERSVSGKGKYHHHPPAKGGEKRETDPRDYGERCRFLFGVFYMLTNALQAMGAAVQALIINLSRQGMIYIPALFILQAILQANGLAWAQPVADLLSTVLVAVLYLWTSRKMIAGSPEKKI